MDLGCLTLRPEDPVVCLVLVYPYPVVLVYPYLVELEYPYLVELEYPYLVAQVCVSVSVIKYLWVQVCWLVGWRWVFLWGQKP